VALQACLAVRQSASWLSVGQLESREKYSESLNVFCFALCCSTLYLCLVHYS